MTVTGEELEHEHGAGSVKKDAIVVFNWCQLIFRAAKAVIQQETFHSTTIVLPYVCTHTHLSERDICHHHLFK